MSRMPTIASKYRVLSWRTSLLLTIELLTTAAFILAFITLCAGSKSSKLQKSPILTFDTSRICGQVDEYLRQQSSNRINDYSHSCKIADWYEVHYLSVCKGDWTDAPTTFVTAATTTYADLPYSKNLSTTSCTPKLGGYTFSLADTLIQDVVPDAYPLFENWTYPVLETSSSLGLLGTTIGQLGTSLIAYFFGFFTLAKLEAANRNCSPSLLPLRIGYLNSILSTILSTISSAKITTAAGALLLPLNDGDENLQLTGVVTFTVWRENGFYILTWMTTGLAWAALIAAVVLAVAIKDIITAKGAIKMVSRAGSTDEEAGSTHGGEGEPQSGAADVEEGRAGGRVRKGHDDGERGSLDQDRDVSPHAL